MRDIQILLERWGGWATSGSSDVDYSPIAAGFKGLLPQTGRSQPSYTGDDALIIEGCLARLKGRKPYEHSLPIAHHLYGIPKRKIVKVRKKDEKLICIEIQTAEGFIDGCLATLDIRLEMDD